ncbi:alpha-E domain-containing protein [Reichenbachiella carrageenanivorans]|uniref:Alpha-E domain-containing protein n=1 Tax=Reichenbachiella carrageenanivorans TaxID=2979869 RepID=A0ABY6CXH7_9BACT|nr:alpha-E domain-containing protein [Reichenbachiella carrageenanivorans]UXX78626.1 alpha-E domain-containing protein [Reichenbachiella carrageenanivorans]
MGYRIKTILARHASSFYWLGRYQERAEFLARYLQVKYFSTMDSNMIEYRDLTMRSISYMATGIPPQEEGLKETDIIWNVAINPQSTTSILYYLKEVRENTKGVRNLISNELWESVNKNFHFANNFNSDYLKSRGLYEFTHGVQENSDSFHAKLDSTLLHDNVWAFVKMGIYLERIYQTTRGLMNTFIDIRALRGEHENLTVENHQWLMMLNAMEATDMTRKLFKTSVQQSNSCQFLIFNLEFPRSIAHGFSKINELLCKINDTQDFNHLAKDSLQFKSAKIASQMRYSDYCEIENGVEKYLEYIMSQVFIFNDLIHKEFFDYKK